MIDLKKVVWFLICLIPANICALEKHCKSDPFSKIAITSQKAICKKSESCKNIFVLSYLDNVVVVLADGSKITANSLEITLDSKGVKIFENKSVQNKKMKSRANKPKNNEKISHLKKIIFKNNVKISNQNRLSSSDSAEIDIIENLCKLDGNVIINQTKTSQRDDIPLNIKSSSALINLKTSEVTLLGSSSEPVSTVVELSKNVLRPERKKS
jgi:lipopolysaccharide export system protein LptA